MFRKNICSIIMIGLMSQQALVIQCTDYQKSQSEEDGFSPANYQFQYAVNEGSSGNDFGHEEERNGHQTRGQYRVLLPDGRLQVVSYTADKNGYRAEVTYQAGAGGAFKGYSAPAPQPKAHAPPPPPAEQGYGLPASSTGSESASSYNSNKRNTGSYVKLRRNINGRNFNYAF